MWSWQPLQYVTSAFGNDCLHHIKITRDKISKRPFSYLGKVYNMGEVWTLLYCTDDDDITKLRSKYIGTIPQGNSITLIPSVQIYQIYSWNISNISEHYQRDSIPPLHPVLRVHVISLDVPPVPLMTWNAPLDIWLDLLSIKPIIESQQREFWGWQNAICDTPGSHWLRMSSV